MDLLNRDQLKMLAEEGAQPCVSMYMPTERVDATSGQNAIRFKNLLRDTQRQLVETGMSEGDARALLEAARERLTDDAFWNSQSDGLAIFVTPQSTRFHRLPMRFEELTIVGPHFHLKPLFPIVATNNRFFVLALSQNRVCLYQATHYSISQVQAEDIPSNIQEILKYEWDEQSVQHHSGARGGRREGIFHGQGRQDRDNASSPNDEIRRFFQEVDRGVCKALQDENAPLVIAGVDYYMPIYRDVNQYAHLVENAAVKGSPETFNTKDLHARAWEVVEPIFLEQQREAIDRYEEAKGQGSALASASLTDVVPSAVFSRIDTLIVPIGEHVWGRFDAENNQVTIHDERSAGDVDLLDLAAMHTYMNGGTVHALKPENMPNGSNIAALFRFPVEANAMAAS